MHNFFLKHGLQFFAEGASAGDGGAEASSGAETAAAGQNESLESMGVPAKEIEKYRAIKGRSAPKEAPAEPAQQDAAADEPAEAEAPKAQSLKEALKSNSDWNREMQGMMSERVKNTNAKLGKAMNILGMIAKDQGMDVEDLSQLDLDALTEKVENDDRRYRKMAAELGVDTATAKELDRQKRENAQLKAQQKQAEDRQAALQHYENLKRQAEELKQSFPDFDLEAELQNQEFFERTKPGSRDTVKTAYYAMHGEEIARRSASRAAEASKRATVNSMRAGQHMPSENGTVQRAASPVRPKLFSQMSPEERKAFEREVKSGRRFD